MRKEWYDQLPVITALCYSAQEEPDVDDALTEALEILDVCASVDMARGSGGSVSKVTITKVERGK